MIVRKTGLGWAGASGVALVLVAAALAGGGDEESSMGKTYALIVGGISRDPPDRLARNRMLDTLGVYLRGPAGLTRRQVSVLRGLRGGK